MVTADRTTALVVDIPTPLAPPDVKYPIYVPHCPHKVAKYNPLN